MAVALGDRVPDALILAAQGGGNSSDRECVRSLRADRSPELDDPRRDSSALREGGPGLVGGEVGHQVVERLGGLVSHAGSVAALEQRREKVRPAPARKVSLRRTVNKAICSGWTFS